MSNRPRIWVKNPVRAGFIGWLFRYYLFAFLVVGVAGLAYGLRVYRAYDSELPALDGVVAYETTAPGVTRIFAADGTMLAELAREYRSYVRIGEIPEIVVQAFLATEDRRFFNHEGLDVRGLARAVVANFRSGTVVQGGSTITQQVAKKRLSADRTLDRKIREALLSIRLETQLSKHEILEIYLNEIFLGHGAHGVSAAAGRYFGKSLKELSLAEAALIAGLARAPSRYNPARDPDRARRRRAVVLQNMVAAGFISEEQRDVADAEPITLVRKPDVFRQRVPYYAEHVRRTVSAQLGDDAVLTGGLQIETPAQLQLAVWGHDAMDHAIRKLDRRQGYRGPLGNLRDPSKRAELKQRLTAKYGPTPLESDPERWRIASVEEVNLKYAKVELGAYQARLNLRHMSWASHYDRNTGVNDTKIKRVDHALVVGDVIWVRPVMVKVEDEPDTKKGEKGEPKTDHRIVATDRKSGERMVELGQGTRNEAAVYTLEHNSGYVTGMQGGHDYDRSQFNRATQACRQPGSVFKAIYYALALDTGDWAMDSILEDKPYEPESGETWNPQNIGKTLDGKVLLRTALIRSLNLPSIRLFNKLGAKNVVAWARRLGFTTELIADRALSLGASCVHIDELSRAFAIFARGGTWVEPVYVRRIVDKTGATLVDNRNPEDPRLDVAGRLDRMGHLAYTPPNQVVDPRTAFLITRLLREVVTAGIGYSASHIGVPAGGKTGTASKNTVTTDTWLVGLTSREVTAAWMGDDRYERSMGEEDASYTTAAPMWTHYMKPVVAGVPHGPIPTTRPPGLTSKSVDARTGGPPVAGMPTAKLYYRH